MIPRLGSFGEFAFGQETAIVLPPPAELRTVDSTFKQRLAEHWTLTDAIGVNGITEPPTSGASFLVIQYPVINSEKPGVGRRYFDEGAARFVLNVQRGVEWSDGAAWADELASLFRDKKLGFGIETFTPSEPIVNDTNDDGNYFSLSVIVPFRYQFNDA